jgi:hypothetical protein
MTRNEIIAMFALVGIFVIPFIAFIALHEQAEHSQTLQGAGKHHDHVR